MLVSEAVKRAIKHDTGRSIYELMNQTLWERRKEVERYGPILFSVNSPIIGRGNQLGERTLSHAKVEYMLEKALRRLDESARNQ